jgi:hypothetical protein
MPLFEQTLLRTGLRWSLRSHARCHSLAPGSGTCARVMSRATFRPVPQGRFAPAFCAAQSVHGAASRRQLRSFSSQPGAIVWVLLWRLVSKAKLWLATSRALTPQSTGRPTAGFARRRPPVTSNVRPIPNSTRVSSPVCILRSHSRLGSHTERSALGRRLGSDARAGCPSFGGQRSRRSA